MWGSFDKTRLLTSFHPYVERPTPMMNFERQWLHGYCHSRPFLRDQGTISLFDIRQVTCKKTLCGVHVKALDGGPSFINNQAP